MDQNGPSALETSPSVFILPPELLATIFIINEHLEYSHDNGKSPRYASQVCNHWRNIALSCPPLWTRIANMNNSSPEWIDQLLERSKGAPLIVKGYIRDEQPTIAKLCSILQHASRFDTFQMVVLSSSPLIDDVLRQLLLRPSPFLRSLCIIDQSKLLFNTIAPSYPDPLFEGEASLLQDLRIRNIAINLASPLLHNVRNLEVIEVSHNLAPSVGKWLNILANFSLLETLSVSDAFADSDELETSLPEVHLPNLSCLNLHGSFSECIRLLSHLVLPAACSLGLGCSETRSHKASDFSVMQQIITKMLNSWPADVVSSKLEVFISPEFLSACNDDLYGCRALERKIPALELTFFWSDPYNETALLLSVLKALEAARLVNVTELHLDISREICVQFRPALLHFISFFPALEVLKVTSRGLRKLFPLLQGNDPTNTEGPSNEAQATALLPSLRTIILDMVFCNEETRTHLFSFLQWRVKIGASIDMINVAICCHSDKLMDGLKKVDRLTIVGAKVVETEQDDPNDSDDSSDDAKSTVSTEEA
ncbi:hypothetical protein BDQ12DRAFT_684215 [Crucibulum laeve]|uniref:Uncharacterized protein n=1 Tax=Crucibulum laeve TaxID=68775 RepID=A0A5C3MAR1_9AGAR|nr:hypothetical protein BDQ12DRAFT_684215 [Crucibulum laeve]